MLTFFTTAKPFIGHSAVIQRNALQSWKLVHPDAEVILFGDEEGAAETALELGLRHEPITERDAHGCKRLDYLFRRAQEIARYDVLCYSNCDIVMTQDFRQAVTQAKRECAQYVMVGRRWDAEISEPLDFRDCSWQTQLRGLAMEHDRQRGAEWIDYFVFSKGVYDNVPPMVIGRVFWDNWLVWKARARNVPLIDASRSVMAVHQNHDYGYHPLGKIGVWNAEESAENYRLAGGWKHLRTISDATLVLQPNRLTSNWPTQAAAFARRNLRQAGRFGLHRIWHPLWFSILGLTRPLRSALGWRSTPFRRAR